MTFSRQFAPWGAVYEDRLARAHRAYRNNETDLADAILAISEELGVPIKDSRVQNDPNVARLREKDEQLQSALAHLIANRPKAQL